MQIFVLVKIIDKFKSLKTNTMLFWSQELGLRDGILYSLISEDLLEFEHQWKKFKKCSLYEIRLCNHHM
jgi:hypothetical protein